MALPKSAASRRARRGAVKAARTPAKFAYRRPHEPGEDAQLERLLFAAARLRASRSLAD